MQHYLAATLIVLSSALGAEQPMGKFQLKTDVVICDTYDQIIASIKTRLPVQGCGMTQRVFWTEIVDLPDLEHDGMTFDIVQYQFPFMNPLGEVHTWFQYGFWGPPKKVTATTVEHDA